MASDIPRLQALPQMRIDPDRKLTDSYNMWIRRQMQVQARMPSTRPHPLNPRLPAAPVTPVTPAAATQPVPHVPAASTPRAHVPAPAGTRPSAGRDKSDEEAARAGGFHESSYELQHGLQISESEWPDDVTVPGRLDER